MAIYQSLTKTEVIDISVTYGKSGFTSFGCRTTSTQIIVESSYVKNYDYSETFSTNIDTNSSGIVNYIVVAGVMYSSTNNYSCNNYANIMVCPESCGISLNVENPYITVMDIPIEEFIYLNHYKALIENIIPIETNVEIPPIIFALRLPGGLALHY